MDSGCREGNPGAVLAAQGEMVRHRAMRLARAVCRQPFLSACSGRIAELYTTIKRITQLNSKSNTTTRNQEYLAEEASISCPLIARKLALPRTAAVR